jgi:hypothetical protein
MTRSPWIQLSLMFVLTLSISACSDNGDTAVGTPLPGSFPTTYSYRGYNSKGALVVVGSVTLAVTGGSILGGTWALECIVPGENVGPQTGSGTLAGTIQGAKANLDLNPGWADNNVFLSGTFETDRFIGSWTWSTFAGPTSAGTFEAVKSH